MPDTAIKSLRIVYCCRLVTTAAITAVPATAVAAVAAVTPGTITVQNYPAKPIRFIVPQATGGSNDILARHMGHHLSERLGKQVVVDNRAGADGIISTDIAARSAPDGYTWLMASGPTP